MCQKTFQAGLLNPVYRGLGCRGAVSAVAGLFLFSASAWAQTGTVAVAAYGFSEGSGITTADASGNGLTGTLQSATWTTSGKFGAALVFNGTTGYVDLGNPTALQLTSSATWSAWVFPTANPGDDGQIIAKSGNGDGWQLKTTPDTGVRTFGVAVSSGASNVQRYSKTVLSLNNWYYVAGVYNASTQSLDIYVNGVLDNGTLTGTVPAAQNNSTVNANIGRRSGGFYFIGTLDEVRVYNRALSQTEIQSDMNTLVGSTAPPSTSACDLAAPAGTIDSADVQAAINMALGISPCTANIAGAGVCNVAVVQRVVNAMAPPTGTGACLTGTGTIAHNVALTWSASTSTNVTGYNVYRSTTSGGSYAKVNTSLVAALTYTDNGVQAGLTYYYVLTAVDNTGAESGFSTQAQAIIPTP